MPPVNNADAFSKKDVLTIAWNYFTQHSQQRILYFNYFILFSAISSSALFAIINIGHRFYLIGAFLGFVQAFLSYIFLKIDKRNKFLTKHAEGVIKELELEFPDSQTIGTKITIFTSEEYKTNIANLAMPKHKFNLSHGQAYILIYRFFIFVGIFGCILSSFQYLMKPNLISNDGISVHSISNQKIRSIDTLVVKLNTLYIKMGRDSKKLDSILDSNKINSKNILINKSLLRSIRKTTNLQMTSSTIKLDSIYKNLNTDHKIINSIKNNKCVNNFVFH